MMTLTGPASYRFIRRSLLIAALILPMTGCGRDELPTANNVVTTTPYPDRPPAQMLGAEIELYKILIGGNAPGRPMGLDLYLPVGQHAPGSLPCVLIAPAGTYAHGSVIGDSDRPEHLPYVRAGFAVVCYELSGDVPNPRARHTYTELTNAIKQFMESDGGLRNGQIAIDYVLKKVPEVSPDQLYACGHSSAAVVALNLAAGDSRIRACCAYAPKTDVEEWWGKDPQLARLIPGFSEFATRKSPLRHAGQIGCPVFLFHADDDSMVSLADNDSFAQAMRAANKDITFERVPKGEHYDSMINVGIPHGIEFMKSQGAKPLPSRPKTPSSWSGNSKFADDSRWSLFPRFAHQMPDFRDNQFVHRELHGGGGAGHGQQDFAVHQAADRSAEHGGRADLLEAEHAE
jgi:acetyl esterase/lipase